MLINGKILKITAVLMIVVSLITSTSLKMYNNFKGVTEITLKDTIIPLKTVQAGDGFEDMEPLKQILKDKKIVAMGEATHGTKEFFQMKHRMFEFLVEEMGYRLFAIEADFGNAQIVNDYVLYGKGSAKGVLNRLSCAVWDTQEVADMIEWMRNYNENPDHKSKVKFYGLDMQVIQYYKEVIPKYLNKVDRSLIVKVNNYLEDISFLQHGFTPYTKYMDKIFIKNRNEINNIISLFNKNKDIYISKSSLNEYQLIYHDLICIYQYCYGDKISRDKSMCDNVKWILDYEKQFGNDKIMLWAHNYHVSSDKGFGTMGSELKSIYADEVYTIGFEFYDGSFRGVSVYEGFKPMKCLKPDEGTFPEVLSRANKDIYFMDFKNASADENIKSWLSTGQNCHYFDASGYDETILNAGDGYLTPINTYDGIIFIRHTNAAEGLGWYS